MATKALSIWPTAQMPLSKTTNGNAALADYIRLLAGNAATMRGWIVGGDTLDTETTNPALPCPGHGLRGHDHSGGLYGRPLRRTIACVTFARGDEYEGTADIDGGDSPNAWSLTTTASTTAYILTPRWGPIGVWVPGCDPGERGAYGACGITVTTAVTTATNVQVGDILRYRVKNHTTGSVADVDDATVSTTGFARCDSGAASRLVMLPGAMNVVEVQRVSLRTTATVATRTLAGSTTHLEIGVYST